jgi:putative ABC transport system substrate-binding protein
MTVSSKQKAVSSKRESYRVFRAIVLCLLPTVFLPTGSLEAQQPAKAPRIGYMHNGSKSDASDEAFRQGLRDFGYIDGKNVVVESRYPEGKLDRLPDIVAELIRLKVDILVAGGEPGVRAAKNGTKTIPIVMVGVGPDPVELGLVKSLARPGGNITGLTLIAVEIAGKRLELFKEAVPKLARVDVVYDPAARGNVQEAQEVHSAGRPLGLTSESWEVRGTADFERVFAALTKARPDGLYVPGGALMNAHRKLIADFALKSRMPSVYVRRESVDAGGLMSYGVDPVNHFRRAAYFVDKILKGSKPAELPVERPTKFEFAINLKTAKQIGLTIPQSILFRADKVIK